MYTSELKLFFLASAEAISPKYEIMLLFFVSDDISKLLVILVSAHDLNTRLSMHAGKKTLT